MFLRPLTVCAGCNRCHQQSGVCVNGECDCFWGLTGVDCSISTGLIDCRWHAMNCVVCVACPCPHGICSGLVEFRTIGYGVRDLNNYQSPTHTHEEKEVGGEVFCVLGI